MQSTEQKTHLDAVYPVYELTIDWDGDRLSIQLAEDDWERVCKGHPLIIEELDDQDEIELRWLFNNEVGSSLIVDFGDPNHIRFVSQIADAKLSVIREQR